MSAAPDQLDARSGTALTRQPGRAGAATGRGIREDTLHDAVLAGVIGEHRATARWLQQIDRIVERTGQHVELTIDLDADRLERALGRMATAAARRRRNRVADDLAQFEGGHDGTRRHDGARNP